jgi:hypothetical protein
MNVVVEYNAIQPLPAGSVELNGEVFKCSTCCTGGSCVCCQDLDGGRATGCQKCSCQKVIDNNAGGCLGSSCCYTGTCFTNCSGGCAGESCNTNAPIYSTSVSSITASCASAQNYINNPLLIGQVTNVTQIEAQCNAVTQIECCKGNSSLGQSLCGPYWGPANTQGTCDGIMENYCSVLPNDPQCTCLTSSIPSPECTDKTCSGTNAMKLSTMINNPCSGNYMTCQQYFELSPQAVDNLIQNNTLSQQCGQSVTTGASSSTSNSNLVTWVLIAAGILVGVVVLGCGAFVLVKNYKKSPKKSKTNKKQFKSAYD